MIAVCFLYRIRGLVVWRDITWMKRWDMECANPISDGYATKPLCAFDDVARVLAKRLVTVKPAVYTLGLFGEYGSGKTTLLRCIERLTRDGAVFATDVDDKPVTAVWFEAWRHDHEENLFLPFLSSLHNQTRSLYPDVDEPPALRALSSFLRGLKITGRNIPFLPGIEVEIDASKSTESQTGGDNAGKAAHESIARAVSGFDDVPKQLRKLTCGDDDRSSSVQRRIICLVDDLDRCKPSSAFRMIECMKSLADIPGWIWVFALDSRVITTQFKEKYRGLKIDPQEYLRKIVTETHVLSPMPLPEAYEELGLLLWRANDEPDVDEHLVKALCELRPWLPNNLRYAKRLANATQTLLALHGISKEEDTILLLGIAQLREAWPEVFDELAAKRDEFLKDAERDLTNAGSDSASEAKRMLRKITGDFEDRRKERLLHFVAAISGSLQPKQGTENG